MHSGIEAQGFIERRSDKVISATKETQKSTKSTKNKSAPKDANPKEKQVSLA